MLKVLRNPPTPAWKFELSGIRFERNGDEPFIFTREDGTADVDMKTQRPGFVNRIMRYALANSIPLEEQDILWNVWRNIASPHRKSYFSGGVGAKPARVPGKLERYHQAPIPPGLMEAARRQSGADVAAEDDGEFLHELNASEWLRVLADWKTHSDDPQNPDKFGPVWWYALHAMGFSKHDRGYANGNVKQWISVWHSKVPCPDCRDHFRKFTLRRPHNWEGLEVWAERAHDWVTQNK